MCGNQASLQHDSVFRSVFFLYLSALSVKVKCPLSCLSPWAVQEVLHRVRPLPELAQVGYGHSDYSLLLFLKALFSECIAVKCNGQALWFCQVLAEKWQFTLQTISEHFLISGLWWSALAKQRWEVISPLNWALKSIHLSGHLSVPLLQVTSKPFLRQLICCWYCTGASCWSRYRNHLSLKQIMSVFSYDKNSLRTNCYYWFENRLINF